MYRKELFLSDLLFVNVSSVFFLNKMFFSLRPHHVFRISKSSFVHSGGSRIFPRGCANSQNCYYFSNFCRKLHENERIWTPVWRASLAPHLDPPMVHINWCGLEVNGKSVLYLFKINSSLIVVLIPVKYVIIITARKRSLGQGNIFRSMCQEFCPGGEGYPSMPCRWYPSMPCRSPGPHPRGKLRGLAWGGLQAHTQGELRGLAWGGLQAHTWGSPSPHFGGCPACTEADTLPADSYCCGWYASYWNAFLFVETSKEVIATVHLLADWIKFKTYQKSFRSMNRCDVLACTIVIV